MSTMLSRINADLGARGLKLRVESAREAYKGHSLAMSDVANDTHISFIRGVINAYCSQARMRSPECHLPHSHSPRSKAFMRITDVPYWNSTTDASHKMSADHVRAYVRASPLNADILGALAGEFRLHHTSEHSSTSTVFFDIWDSQSGAWAKTLIGKTVMIRGRACKILTAPKRVGVPWCKKCCKWGHTLMWVVERLPASASVVVDRTKLRFTVLCAVLQRQPKSEAAGPCQQGDRVPSQTPVPQLSRGPPCFRLEELRVLEAQVRCRVDRSSLFAGA